MAQIGPEPNYSHRLAEWATLYLQTRDSRVFPFTSGFTAEQQTAFVRDLREGLSDLQDSGSARKSSAVGFVMSDTLLHEVVASWAAADGDWPASHDPSNPDARVSLASG